jgi:DNA modification methylase
VNTPARATVLHGDCIALMANMPDNSVDAIVTDPPYGLGFMGKEWDSGKSFVERKAAKRNTFDHVGGNHNPKDSKDKQRTNLKENTAFGEWCLEWTTECLRVLKPGGHLLAFGGTRTWHRLACAVEDAGFEVRDSIAWLYGSGFPKSLDVSRAIDAHQKHGGSSSVQKRQAAMGDEYTQSDVFGQFRTGHIDTMNTPRSTAPEQVGERTPDAEQWRGFGTALKPAFEPVVVARKPLVGTVATNVLAHGTGAINVDACRVEGDKGWPDSKQYNPGFLAGGSKDTAVMQDNSQNPSKAAGRWPANVVLDETQADALDQMSGTLTSGKMLPTRTSAGVEGRPSAYGADAAGGFTTMETYGDTGGASRFFYVAKAPKKERPNVEGIAHPTVKPLKLMRWLVRLVTPPGGLVLDPFGGSGTTAEAAILEGFNVTVIEREADYLPLIEARLARAFTATATAATVPTVVDLDLLDLLDGGAA